MKRWLAPFLAGLLFLAQAVQAELTVNQLNGFDVGGGPVVPTISFIGCTEDNTDLTTYTFTNHAVGTAAANRTTIVAAMGDDSATLWDFSSMTVGGNSAAQQIESSGGTSNPESSIYAIANPSGTTSTIVVTASEAVTEMTVCVWAAYGLNSVTATDTATGNTLTTIALDVDVSAGGLVVGACINSNASRSFTWTGITESSDFGGGAEVTYSTANDAFVSAQAPVSPGIGCTITVGNNSSGVAAAFR